MFTQTGTDTWARACRSHPGLDVTPQQSLPLDDLLEVFQRHQSVKNIMCSSNSRSPSQVSGSPSPTPASEREDARKHKVNRSVSFTNNNLVEGVRNLNLDGLSYMPTSQEGMVRMQKTLSGLSAEACLSIVTVEGLDHAKVNGVDNILPKNSLTKVDLSRGPLHAYARMVAVAHHEGNAKLVSKIRSSQKFQISTVPNLPAWWKAATLNDKLSLLSVSSKLSVTKALGSLDDRQRRGLSSLPHPFRGGAEEMVIFDSPQEWYSSGGEEDL